MSDGEDIGTAALRQFVDAKGSQRAAAARLRCTPQFIGQILRGEKRVPDSILRKLGLRRREIVEAK